MDQLQNVLTHGRSRKSVNYVFNAADNQFNLGRRLPPFPWECTYSFQVKAQNPGWLCIKNYGPQIWDKRNSCLVDVYTYTYPHTTVSVTVCRSLTNSLHFCLPKKTMPTMSYSTQRINRHVMWEKKHLNDSSDIQWKWIIPHDADFLLLDVSAFSILMGKNP